MARTAVIFVVALLALASTAGAKREVLQSANPPSPGFGGAPLSLDASVSVPAGNVVRTNWHLVGTTNYSSSSASTYVNAGAVGDFYLQNGTNVVGRHYFQTNNDGTTSPVYIRVDASGNINGTLVARTIGNQTVSPYNNDGGYGSVPTLLLQTVSADGFFAGVTYVQRVNTVGGTVPGNPRLFTLPASNTGIPNKLLAVPYQSDYLFYIAGTPGSPPTSTSPPAPTG